MAKKIKDEKGRTYVQKKPIYKKWWFWLIIVIIIVGAFGTQESSSKKSNGGTKVTKTSGSKSKESSSEENNYYSVGDSVNVGDIIYTLHSVELTDERNQFDDTNPEYVIKVSYTMENKTDSDVPVGTDVSAYGPDTKKLDTYANDNTLGSVAVGKSIDVVQHFGLNQLGEIELQFAPMISLEKTADFKVNVQ